MGLFSRNPKGTVLDAIGIDLSNYPDNTFTQEQDINGFGNNLTNHFKYLEESLFLDIFSQLMVVTFENSTAKNFIFRCPVFEEFKKSSLSELVNNIYDVYGSDNMGYNRFSSDDWKQIKEEGFWLGRSWTDDKYSIACSLGFDEEEDGLSFTIWTK